MTFNKYVITFNKIFSRILKCLNNQVIFLNKIVQFYKNS